MLLDEALEKYLVYLEALGRKPRTIDSAEERISYFVNYCKSNDIQTLEQIKPELVDLYIASMRRKGLSMATIAGRQQALKALLNWCVHRDYLKKSPAAHLKKPRINYDTRNKAINQSDLEAMLKYAKEKRKYLEEVALAILADTGCRPGELCSIKLEDIDLINREIIVRGKTGERIVDYSSATDEIIERYLSYRSTLALPEEKAFLINAKGEPATSNTIYLRFRAIAQALKIKRFNPQSIRHRVGQGWIDAGANLELVRLKLGDKDISTTSMFYANQDRTRIKLASEKFSLMKMD